MSIIQRSHPGCTICARARLTEYAKARPNAIYHEGKGVWSVKCDVALPCATQNELLLDDAKALVANGCFAVAEGANMPTSLDATAYLQENGVLFVPGKASNAGGVATSALEMGLIDADEAAQMIYGHKAKRGANVQCFLSYSKQYKSWQCLEKSNIDISIKTK